MGIGERVGNVYKIPVRRAISEEAHTVDKKKKVSKLNSDDINLWHARLGHVHKSAIEKMEKEYCVTGLDSIKHSRQKACEH